MSTLEILTASLTAHGDTVTVPDRGTVNLTIEATDAASAHWGALTIVLRFDHASGVHGRHVCRFYDADDYSRTLADALWELGTWLDSAEGRLATMLAECHALIGRQSLRGAHRLELVGATERLASHSPTTKREEQAWLRQVTSTRSLVTVSAW